MHPSIDQVFPSHNDTPLFLVHSMRPSGTAILTPDYFQNT
jgi:hypothetical protein